MEEQVVSYEVAQRLKSLDFDYFVRNFYTKLNGYVNLYHCDRMMFDYCSNSSLEKINSKTEENIAAPTQSIVMKWLREKYNIHIEVEVYYCEDGQMWLAKIQRIESAKTSLIKTCMVNETYEDAVDNAIKWCLENFCEKDVEKC